MAKEKSDLSRAFSEDGERKTHVGGQALIEGIMMRGKYNWSVAVREPSGAVYTEEHDLASGKAKNGWLYWPLVRGCRALVESLMLGYKALEVATMHAYADDEASCDEASDGEGEFGKKEMAISMVCGLVLGVVLFIVAPAFITNLIVGEYDGNTLLWNIVDGVLRVAVFVFYIWLIGRMSEIKRMFGYHGAEHKTIHCYEHGLPLTPENARSFPRLHVRCGTAFLIMVMIIAIFVYTVVPLNALIAAWGVPDGAPKLALVIVSRIVLMPVIAGVSYEITVKWAGSHPENPLVKVVLWPGMQMQYLTTNEPDDGMLECAIAAMQQVLRRRLTHFKNGDTGFDERPDALLIDGGIEHARVAEDVLQTLGLSIPTYGMVKDDRHRTRALVTAAGDEIAISAVPSVFALIGTIQEETHRFAITYQRTLRSRRMKASGLEDIPGIGEKRRQALLKKFRSVKAISQAGQAELEQVLPVPAAQAVYRHFHPQEGGTACASSQEPPEASR